jgi:hypothetical protein
LTWAVTFYSPHPLHKQHNFAPYLKDPKFKKL